MSRLTPPSVPEKLRELLNDYPGHIDRLQEILDEFAVPQMRLQPLDEAIWALKNRIEAFIQEATEELNIAEASGDVAEIERAKEKRELMFSAYSNNGGMGGALVELWQYFEKNKEVFE